MFVTVKALLDGNLLYHNGFHLVSGMDGQEKEIQTIKKYKRNKKDHKRQLEP